MSNAWRFCLVVAGACSLVACSDAPGGADAEGSRAAVSTPGSVSDITEIIHAPGAGEFVGALTDITNVTCVQVGEGLQVTGDATNSTSAPVDYRIYISLINGAATTRALVEAEVLAVAPGAVGSFDKLVSLSDDDLRCVLRVERRAPGA